MKVGIIGTGLQFNRRAPVVYQSDSDEIISVCGKNKQLLDSIESEFECQTTDDWKKIVSSEDIDTVIVCTPPNLHAEICSEAIRNNKHVLCEKPLTKTLDEAKELVSLAKEYNVVLKCGFNHRHHPAVLEGKKIVSNFSFGEILFARCRYGICGRLNYHEEWRANPDIAAGGHFIEQGSHIIDLFRWFLGDLEQVTCMTSKNFFKKQKLDESGMALFRSSNGATASLHTSLTEWKNLFSFEVFGENEYIQIEGLGGGYGTEKLIHGIRDHVKPFSYKITEYRGPDKSWLNEWLEFKNAIKNKVDPLGSGLDGMQAMKIALMAYEAEKNNKILWVNDKH